MPANQTASSEQSGERRSAERLQTWLRVDYCPLVSTGKVIRVGGMQRGIIVDLSTSGMFLTEVGYLQLGTILHLFIRLPDIPANPIACHAKVIRREILGRTGYAVRFLRLRESDSRRIAQFIRAITRRQRLEAAPAR